MTQLSPPNRANMRRQWKAHKFIWKISGGRLGQRVVGLPVLELVTQGSRSGQDRSILITYIDDPRGLAIIGTNAGLDIDPAWVKNLRAQPNARIRVNRQWTDVVAREVSGDEHARVWATATAASPGYNGYLETLTRPVPILRLERK
jgi:F420H(2)-dependent quinone reductase